LEGVFERLFILLDMSVSIFETGISGCCVELQPVFGTTEAAVLHMLSGGANNPEGFGPILDVYACTAVGKGLMRGAHVHKVLDEFFFPASGSALWVLCDMREGSPTYKKTAGVVLSLNPVETPNNVPLFTATDGTFPRLRVPHGVYHAFVPINDERVLITALGSTPHVPEDYVYPSWDEIPGVKDLVGDTFFALMRDPRAEQKKEIH